MIATRRKTNNMGENRSSSKTNLVAPNISQRNRTTAAPSNIKAPKNWIMNKNTVIMMSLYHN